MNLLELFDVHNLARELADTTRETYHYQARAWLAWCDAHGIEPHGATRRNIELHRDELKARNLSEAARSLRIIVVRAFYEMLIENEQISSNPAQRVRSRRTRKTGHKALSKTQLKTLFLSLENAPRRGYHSDEARLRDRAIVALMALHGLRRIECQRLDWADLDEKSAPQIRVLGKGGHVRVVYLRADTLEFLHEYRNALKVAELPVNGALFVSLRRETRGHRLTRDAIAAAIEKRLKAACLREKGVLCHALRHTFGTLAVAGGASIEHVRDAMGHSNLTTTSIYVRAVERIENNPALHIEL